MAELSACFVCLKRLEGSSQRGGDNDDDSVVNIDSCSFSRFWSFAQEYLQVPAVPLVEKQCFCADCENVVGSICQLYQELLITKLNLSTKLGELAKLLEHSEKAISNKLGRVLSKSLAEQLGITGETEVDELRRFLKTKCESCLVYMEGE